MNEPRLIVADDSPVIHTMIAQLVAPDYSIVASVRDGRAAVEAVQQLQPHLVLLDIAMPVLDGFEAARQIRQCCPSVSLIFVSEHRNQAYVKAAFSAGATGYVVKSRIVTELVPAIKEVLAGRDYGRPIIAEAKVASWDGASR